MSSRLAAGHSHYFRELMRHFAAPGVSLRDAAGAALVAALEGGALPSLQRLVLYGNRFSAAAKSELEEVASKRGVACLC